MFYLYIVYQKMTILVLKTKMDPSVLISSILFPTASTNESSRSKTVTFSETHV